MVASHDQRRDAVEEHHRAGCAGIAAVVDNPDVPSQPAVVVHADVERPSVDPVVVDRHGIGRPAARRAGDDEHVPGRLIALACAERLAR